MPSYQIEVRLITIGSREIPGEEKATFFGSARSRKGILLEIDEIVKEVDELLKQEEDFVKWQKEFRSELEEKDKKRRSL